MNEPAAIQSRHAKWMEDILVCLGICIPIQFGPVVYQHLQWSHSTPELLSNGLGALLILTISLGLLLKFQTLSVWILQTPTSNAEASRRGSELSEWLTIGIVTFGILVLVHTIPLTLFS